MERRKVSSVPPLLIKARMKKSRKLLLINNLVVFIKLKSTTGLARKVQSEKVLVTIKKKNKNAQHFQKKYEYNPPHVHAGELSFIYWSKVPYTTKSETNAAPSPQANAISGVRSTLNGATYFVFNRDAWYLEHPGKTIQPGDSYGANLVTLPVTKKWEGVFCLFPSYQMHGVNPFYSSDECRVSYSANVTFRKPSSIL